MQTFSRSVWALNHEKATAFECRIFIVDYGADVKKALAQRYLDRTSNSENSRGSLCLYHRCHCGVNRNNNIHTKTKTNPLTSWRPRDSIPAAGYYCMSSVVPQSFGSVFRCTLNIRTKTKPRHSSRYGKVATQRYVQKTHIGVNDCARCFRFRKCVC